MYEWNGQEMTVNQLS